MKENNNPDVCPCSCRSDMVELTEKEKDLISYALIRYSNEIYGCKSIVHEAETRNAILKEVDEIRKICKKLDR